MTGFIGVTRFIFMIEKYINIYLLNMIMTKEGYKQVMVGIDTWGMLKKQSIKQKMSINQLIQGFIRGLPLNSGSCDQGSNPCRATLNHRN
jgi:hypothetical protein